MTAVSNALGFFQEFLPDRNFSGFRLCSSSGFCNLTRDLSVKLQSADPIAIKLLEKSGSTYCSVYLDSLALRSAIGPVHFLDDQLVPRRKIPPENLLGFYLHEDNRGYLDSSDTIFDIWDGIKSLVSENLCEAESKLFSTPSSLQGGHNKAENLSAYKATNP